mmetsp:Transcript_8767/g.10712  ORF Transcript_8767/g.10712 Transcript_8767/m.10712 type:complete len:259 (-) Transcript_8767:666-1442(-)
MRIVLSHYAEEYGVVAVCVDIRQLCALCRDPRAAQERKRLRQISTARNSALNDGHAIAKGLGSANASLPQRWRQSFGRGRYSLLKVEPGTQSPLYRSGRHFAAVFGLDFGGCQLIKVNECDMLRDDSAYKVQGAPIAKGLLFLQPIAFIGSRSFDDDKNYKKASVALFQNSHTFPPRTIFYDSQHERIDLTLSIHDALLIRPGTAYALPTDWIFLKVALNRNLPRRENYAINLSTGDLRDCAFVDWYEDLHHQEKEEL